MPHDRRDQVQDAEDLEDLFEHAPCGYLSIQTSGQIIKVNQTFCSWTGRMAEQLVGQRFSELLNIAGRIFYETHFAPLLRMQGFFHEVALDLVCADGKTLPVLVNAVERHIEAAQPRFVRITVFNASDRRRYEQELLAARGAAEQANDRLRAANQALEAKSKENALYRAMVQELPDCLGVKDLDGRYIIANAAMAALLGAASADELIGRTDQDFLPGQLGRSHRGHDRVLVERDEASVIEQCFERNDGTEGWLSSLKAPFCTDSGIMAGVITHHRDITERKRQEEERQKDQERIAFLAHHDVLTGLANRSLFHERLDQDLAHAAEGRGFAVLCLDLDRFKMVNDTLGHPAGDSLLWLVAQRLQACVRQRDLVARIGGDEFAVIQHDVQGAGDAARLAERIGAALSEPYEVGSEVLSIGTSIGIALAPQDGQSPMQLLKKADIALYQVKAKGGMSHCFFELAMEVSLQAQEATKAALRWAVSNGELDLHYQPLIDLRTNQICGFEALLRWRHPVRGIIPPAEFITLAEETRLILPMGEWVLRQACLAARTWPEHLSVAVNLSPIQFQCPELVQVVADILSETGLPPERLQLEITESVLLQDNEKNLITLHTLRRLGVQIAMDDFGTGYSSLGYLRAFPFDKIKIDRSFIEELLDKQEAGAIVLSVIALGHRLGMTVTAEGVETQEQLQVLRAEGCDHAQGYLFSKPVPAEQVARMLKRIGSATSRTS